MINETTRNKYKRCEWSTEHLSLTKIATFKIN